MSVPFFSALLGNGRATVVFSAGFLTITAGEYCASGRYFSLADAAQTGERLAREITNNCLIGQALHVFSPPPNEGESRAERLDRITRAVAEELGLFTPQQEVLSELHQMAARTIRLGVDIAISERTGRVTVHEG